MPEPHSSTQKRKYTIAIVVVFLVLIILTYVWNGLVTGTWVGNLVGPSDVSTAGDFFAGTIGVAGTLAAAYLGLVLAAAATETAKQTLVLQKQQLEATERVREQEDLAKQAQEKTANEIRLQEENARRRQIELQIVADVEKTLQGIQRLARAYISTLSRAVTLIAYGSLRDQQSEKKMRHLEDLYGTDTSTWDDASKKEYAAAKEEYGDMYPFRYADFQDFVNEVNELAEAAEAVFWNKSAHDLLKSTSDMVVERCERMLGGTLNSFPSPATDLLGFAQRLQRKVVIAGREIAQPVASGVDAGAYADYCNRILDVPESVLDQESYIELICLSSVCYTFWVQSSDAVNFTSSTSGGDTKQREGNYNVGLLQMLMLLYSIPEEDLVRSVLTRMYLGERSDQAPLAPDAFTRLLERFDLSFGLSKIRNFVDTNLEKIGEIVFVDVRTYRDSQTAHLSQLLEAYVESVIKGASDIAVAGAFRSLTHRAFLTGAFEFLGATIPSAASRILLAGSLTSDERSELLDTLKMIRTFLVTAKRDDNDLLSELDNTIAKFES